MGLEQTDLSKMLETAVVAARLAGQRAIEELGFIKTSVKKGTEIVTQADGICQQLIIDRIKETFPDHGFIAEEGEGEGEGEPLLKQAPRGSEKIWWVIDPIDGTNNFANRMLIFAVSIAVMHKGEPVIGVIFEPATDSMFTAVKGRDAQLNGRKITASSQGIDKFASIALDSHFDNDLPGWVGEIIKRSRFRNLGSAVLHLAYVARGSMVGTILNCPKLWDIAAGAVIAEAAEATVSDWQGGKIFPLDLDGYEGQSLPMIAANKKTHAELLEMLKS